jgi:hypothetical protein
MSIKITQDIIDFAKSAKASQSEQSKEVIRLLESNEDWTVDSSLVEEKIDHLFQNWDEINEEKPVDKKAVLKLLSYLSTGAMIDFLGSLEKIDPDFYKKLIETLNETNAKEMPIFSMLLAKRLHVIYRLMVIPKIFSAERLKALENEINKI